MHARGVLRRVGARRDRVRRGAAPDIGGLRTEPRANCHPRARARHRSRVLDAGAQCRTGPNRGRHDEMIIRKITS